MSVVILGIETSCDETSAAVVIDGVDVASNIIASQVDLHAKFGGVVPEVASRKHLELIDCVVLEALENAKIDFKDINAVAVTYGPGLVGALLVGVMAAKALSYALKVPLVAVNHLEAHIYANFLEKPDVEFPTLCLVVSGGHTDLVLIKHHGSYEFLGSTLDDAAGEAFDKIARAIGLGYPGGPLIDKLAQGGNADAIDFPRVYLEDGSLDFSFSGLKTAVLNYLNSAKQKNMKINTANLAAAFQQAVVDVLVDKTILAAEKYGVKVIMLAGGVASNRCLRNQLKKAADKCGFKVIYPQPILCTDNAAMVACCGYYKYLRGEFADFKLNTVPGLALGE
ncbi:tRNA (adenosine(37)-N6)-threonylcarbamoyltransferase complex transferase subunit TsaD [Peptococcaceae bacterium]|nr:tRNA (adenosine(37)-N6)-threonylcarbamoyltransferase complex transferase subunit TsaD [Peptococcaceae bacterium]